MEECYGLYEKEFLDINVSKQRLIQLDTSPVKLQEYADLLNSINLESSYNFHKLRYAVIHLEKGTDKRI